MPEPDISVVADEEDHYRDHHPTTAALVVEIAVASLAVAQTKAALYSEAAVEEYWIVRAEAEQVEVYRRPMNGVYHEWRLYERSETIEKVSVTDEPVAVDSLFA